MKKSFVFLEVSHYGQSERVMPPYFYDWIEKLGKTTGPFTESQILSLGWVKTTERRICSAKEGTKIRLMKYHATADIYIKRLTESEINKDSEIKRLREELKGVQSEMQALIPVNLKKREYELEVQLKKLEASRKNVR